MPYSHPKATKSYSRPADLGSPVKRDSTDPSKLGVTMPVVAPAAPDVTTGGVTSMKQAQINQANAADNERHRGLTLAKAVVADPYNELHYSKDQIFKSQQRLQNQKDMVAGVKEAAGNLGVDTSSTIAGSGEEGN